MPVLPYFRLFCLNLFFNKSAQILETLEVTILHIKVAVKFRCFGFIPKNCMAEPPFISIDLITKATVVESYYCY